MGALLSFGISYLLKRKILEVSFYPIRLEGIGKIKPINMVIEMADNTKSFPKGIVKNLLIKIDKFIFPVDFVILDMIEDFRMPIILGRPLLATAHAKVDIFKKTISLEVGNEKVIFKMRSRFSTTIFESVRAIKSEIHIRDDDSEPSHWCEAVSQEREGLRKYWDSCDPHNDICDRGGLPNDVERLYWESTHDNERVDLEWEELSFHNWVRIKFVKVCKMTRDRILEDYWRKVFNEAELENKKKEDSEEYGERETNAILEIILEKEDETWFSSTSDDKNDLGGIIDQLKLNLYDKSIDPDNENHQERKYKLLGIIYKEPPSILIEKIEVTRYNIGPCKTYTKTKLLGIDEIPRTSTNVANVRAVLMDELGAYKGSFSKEVKFEVIPAHNHVDDSPSLNQLNIINDNVGSAFMSTFKLNDLILCHARLGHVHFKRMQDMSKDGLIPAFDMNTENLVPEEVTKKVVVQQPKLELRKSKRNRTPKYFGPEFQLYLIEGTKDEGFKQKSEIDYFDTYALVARISTIRLLIALALIHNLIIHQMDVKTTFLNGELDEEVYMNQPQGFIMPGNENKVLHRMYLNLIILRVIGCLMYAMTCIRPDIAFAVGKLSRYTSNPEGYTDANWISNAEDNPSTSDWVFLLGEGAIAWASKKQTCINSSTMESEFVALAATGKEAEWLRNLILKIILLSKPIAPISIRCDSAATLVKACSQMYKGKSRHLGVRYSIIREVIMNGVVSIEFVRS
ncbi:zinc finger, CCHC-type containing protein [Tanacetum coccineum]